MTPAGAFLAADAASALEGVGGMTVLERQLWALSRAGVRRAGVPLARPQVALRLPPDLEVLWASDEAGAAAWVSGAYFYRPGALKEVLAGRPRDDGAPVRTPEERRAALDWLFEGLRKDSDGFMAKHFDRKISMAVTRRLLGTPVRPNHMTLVSTVIGAAGGLLFLPGTGGLAVCGALLVWLHTVLDGCDGELARLGYFESRWGAQLDFWSDNLVHTVLFASMGLGLASREPWAPWLGSLAVLGTLGSAGTSWLLARRREASSTAAGPAAAAHLNPASGIASVKTRGAAAERLKNIEVALAQRDFIYLLVLAALCGRGSWFLWAAGLGAPAYLLVLIGLELASWRASPGIAAPEPPARGPSTAQREVTTT